MFDTMDMDDALDVMKEATGGRDHPTSDAERLERLAKVAEALASVLNEISPSHGAGPEAAVFMEAYHALQRLRGVALNEADRRAKA